VRRSAVLSLLFLPLLPLPAPAQPASAAVPPAGEVFSETIDVSVVNVQVFVSERAGKPVRGLGRDDFQLLVDGKPVPITNFYAGDEAAAEPGAAREAIPAAQRLTLVIYVDDVNLSEQGRALLLPQVESFLRASLHPSDRVLIASSEGTRLIVRQPPAGDIPAIVAALREVPARMAGADHDSAAEVSAYDLKIDGGDGKADLSRASGRVTGELEAMGRLLLRQLREFVGSISRLPGRKAVLYLTEQLQVPLGDPLFRRLVERAGAEQVTLYALGAKTPRQALGSGLERALYEMTAPTGGLSQANGFVGAAFLDRLRDDLGSYYSLGFSPNAPHDGRSHRLEVRVPGRRGVTVRFPASYAAQPPTLPRAGDSADRPRP
jgi:VWFA-related protein